MRITSFIIFFGIVLTIYGLVNYYIFNRGLQALPTDSKFRSIYIFTFIFLASSFWVGRIMENLYLSNLSDFFVWTGGFWLAMILYLFLFILIIDFTRIINHFTGFYPSFIKDNYTSIKPILFGFVTVSTVFIVVFGFINYQNIVITNLEITLPKKSSKMESITVAVASDIHLGTLAGRMRVAKIVEKINSISPDIILFPGDIVDEDLKPVLKQNVGEELFKLKSKYGIYAVTGNHEYIGGVEPAVKYLTDHGIIILRDTTLRVNDSFILVGREDRSINRFIEKQRKPLSKIIANVSDDLPLILMDHQPIDLDEAVKNNIDLQLSGHTHHGQLFPLNFITNIVYEISYGYLKKENTHFYVSSGVTGWGTPVRTGSPVEIVNLKINFK